MARGYNTRKLLKCSSTGLFSVSFLLPWIFVEQLGYAGGVRHEISYPEDRTQLELSVLMLGFVVAGPDTVVVSRCVAVSRFFLARGGFASGFPFNSRVFPPLSFPGGSFPVLRVAVLEPFVGVFRIGYVRELRACLLV